MKIAGCEYTLKKHFAQQKSKLQEIIANIVTESTTTFKQQMARIIMEKTQIFDNHLHAILDDMIQDVCHTTDEAHDTLQVTSEKLFNDFNAKLNE
jgi:predicted oxidoreductase (fatty acid repression mutant protein)